jgi:hypothetical protein
MSGPEQANQQNDPYRRCLVSVREAVGFPRGTTAPSPTEGLYSGAALLPVLYRLRRRSVQFLFIAHLLDLRAVLFQARRDSLQLLRDCRF